jgi:hypothetical protein
MAESPTLNAAEQAALIAQLQSETAALRDELDETNQGVLALRRARHPGRTTAPGFGSEKPFPVVHEP